MIAPFGLVGVDGDDGLQRSQRGPVTERNETVGFHAADGPDVALDDHIVLLRFWLPPEALGNRHVQSGCPLEWFPCLILQFPEPFFGFFYQSLEFFQIPILHSSWR